MRETNEIKPLQCSGYVLREIDGPVLEIVVKDCKTTNTRLLRLMDDYSRHMNEGQDIMAQVAIQRPGWEKNNILGKNLVSPDHPAGIYFFGRARKTSIAFQFYDRGGTKDYLMDFLLQCTESKRF
jgi:hypothetical protein